MNDPRRLLDEGATPEELDLLRSWQSSQPSEGARAALFGALTAGGAAGVAKGGAVVGKGTAVGAAVAAKWLAALAVVGAVGGIAGGVATYARRQSHSRAALVAPPIESKVVAESAPVAAPPPAAVAPVEPAPQPLANPRPQLAEVRTKKAARPQQPSLGEQVSAVDSARRALAAGDAASAIAQVDQYEARFHDGVLVEEAEVLRVEALLAQGDRASATRVGERFLAAHPTSPHAARVRALLTPP